MRKSTYSVFWNENLNLSNTNPIHLIWRPQNTTSSPRLKISWCHFDGDDIITAVNHFLEVYREETNVLHDRLRRLWEFLKGDSCHFRPWVWVYKEASKQLTFKSLPWGVSTEVEMKKIKVFLWPTSGLWSGVSVLSRVFKGYKFW